MEVEISSASLFPTSSNFTHTVVSDLGRAIAVSENYGQEAGVGGSVDWRRGHIEVSSSQQVYDLNEEKHLIDLEHIQARDRRYEFIAGLDVGYRDENVFIVMATDGEEFYLVDGGWAFIDWNRRYPYLCNRYIMPEYRNKGLGSDLVWLRCNEIKQQGYNYAMIKLEDWNTPALSVMKEDIFTQLKDI